MEGDEIKGGLREADHQPARTASRTSICNVLPGLSHFRSDNNRRQSELSLRSQGRISRSV